MNKKLISLVTMATITFTSVSPVFAKNFTSKQNVALNHAWTVKFNKTLGSNQDFSKVTIKDSNGTVVPVDVTINSDKQSVKVAPKGNYNSNTNYTLTIDGLKDSNGKSLSDNAVMQFTTGADTNSQPVVQNRIPFSLTDSQKSQLNTALAQYNTGKIKAEDVIKIVDPDTADYSTLLYTPQPYADKVATNDQLNTWELDGYNGQLGKTDLSKTAGYYKDNVSEACRYQPFYWKDGVFKINAAVDSNNNLLYYDNVTIDDRKDVGDFVISSSTYPLLYNQIKNMHSYFFLNKLNDTTNYKNTIMDIGNSVVGKKSGIPAINFRIDHLPTYEQGMNEGMLEISDVDTLVYLETRKDMLTKYIANAENESGITVNPNVDMRINSVSQNEFIDGTTYDSALDISNPSQDVLNSIYGQLEALVGKEPATVIYNKYIAYMLIQNYAHITKTSLLSDSMYFNYGSIKVQIFAQHIRLWY